MYKRTRQYRRFKKLIDGYFNQAAAAQDLGVSKQAVTNVLLRQRRIGLRLAKKIAEKTGTPVLDWREV